MKKIICAVILVILVLVMCCCSDNTENSDSQSTISSQEESSSYSVTDWKNDYKMPYDIEGKVVPGFEEDTAIYMNPFFMDHKIYAERKELMRVAL